jgi:hypothetical protein
MTYDDGRIASVGDVVTVTRGGGPERYIIIGADQGNFAKLLLIGTVQKEDSPLLGQTIILPTGFTRSAPLDDLVRLGYAEIAIRQGSQVW